LSKVPETFATNFPTPKSWTRERKKRKLIG
jgi:hypothetical protein